MVSAGFPGLAQTGRHIDWGSGSGFHQLDGRGFRANRGDGRLIITVDGRIYLVSDGRGYQALGPAIADLATGTIAGVRRWSPSSIVLHLAATMSDGTR